MYKRLAVIALAILLAASALMTPATAASAVTITVGTVSGSKGDVVELPISISANSYLVNADLLIEFDATRLELVDDYFDEGCYQTAALFGSKWLCVGGEQSDGKFWYFMATSNNIGLTAGGEMVRLAFRILKDDVASLTVTVKADPICGNDGTGALDESGYPMDTNLDFSGVAGAVTIGTTTTTTPPDQLIGDLNFDGRISMQDALLLYAGVSRGTLTEERRAVADYNGDGSVNMRDALTLYAFVSGRTA